MDINVAGNFVSNSFTQNQFALGAQFNLKNIFMVRGGYVFEAGMWDSMNSYNNTNVTSGLSAGVSVAVPLNKEKGSFLSIDYAFRETQSFNNSNSIGLIFNF
jgi:hypothetical protein